MKLRVFLAKNFKIKFQLTINLENATESRNIHLSRILSHIPIVILLKEFKKSKSKLLKQLINLSQPPLLIWGLSSDLLKYQNLELLIIKMES